jgi:hypothetical protein
MRPIALGLIVAFVCILACALPAAAQPQSATSIEKLLGDGWEVAGYVSAWENRCARC